MNTLDRQKSRQVCHMDVLECYYEREPSMAAGVVRMSEPPPKWSCGSNPPLQSVDEGGNMVPMKMSNSDVLANSRH